MLAGAVIMMEGSAKRWRNNIWSRFSWFSLLASHESEDENSATRRKMLKHMGPADNLQNPLQTSQVAVLLANFSSRDKSNAIRSAIPSQINGESH